MEPLRGFAEFMRAAAFAQQHLEDLQVVVAGKDWAPYSYGAPNSNQSWKTYLLDELKGELDLSRLHFPGLVNYGELIRLFQRSDLHCYFTRPYVISWGLFQAAACGTPLLVNGFEGFQEVFRDLADVRQVELDNQAEINAAVLEGLSVPLGKPAGSNLRRGLELTAALQAWRALLLN
jgi:glycosyltransferase involved in cell wall biosynthesis